MVLLACGQASTASTEHAAGTTLTVVLDSEWQVPSGFGVRIPPTHFWARQLLEDTLEDAASQPEFSTEGEVPFDGGLARVTIALFSDGVSDETQPAEVLKSWLEIFVGADFTEPVRVDRDGLHIAVLRGHAQHVSQSAPAAFILTAFRDPETRRMWRLLCAEDAAEVVHDEVARVCQQFSDGFRPLELPGAAR